MALVKTGAEAKIPAVAEKAAENFPQNTDLLLVLANAAISRQQSDRALEYANRLVGALEKRTRPEGVAEADWDRARNASLGRGYWIAGIVSAEKSRFADADKDLRAALPLIKGDQSMTGAALFHLGVADYQIGKASASKAKVLEAAKFSEDAAKITGPFANQAYKNALVMKTEAGKMR